MAKKFNTTYGNPVLFEVSFSLLQTMKCSVFNNMTNEIGMIGYKFCEVCVKATLIVEVRSQLRASNILKAFL